MNILEKISKKLFAGNTLYYPGCLSKFAEKGLVGQYKKILEKEGIDFVMLKDKEFCCGSPVKNAGGQDSFLGLTEKNLEVFKQHGIKRIISNCPSCTLVFKKDYKDILGDKWDIEVLHISEVIDKSLKYLKKQEKGRTATYHDPCHLGRSLGVYDQPREIIKKAGYKLLEMEHSGEKSFCCGAGGGVKTNDPELSGQIGKDRVTQAKETKADALITSCPMCYAQLKRTAGDQMEVYDLCHLFEIKE